jgi:hypothetical protein
VKDSDIIAAIAPDAVSLMDKAIAEIKRLRQEQNALRAERDEARKEVCGWAGQARNLDPNVIAMQRGWNIKVKHEPDALHERNQHGGEPVPQKFVQGSWVDA